MQHLQRHIGGKLTIIWDGLPAHRSRVVREFVTSQGPRLQLEWLPAYAPELNPIENVWEYLRANKLCALVWDTYDAIVQACRGAWQFLVDDPARIQSIGAREWACVNV